MYTFGYFFLTSTLNLYNLNYVFAANIKYFGAQLSIVVDKFIFIRGKASKYSSKIINAQKVDSRFCYDQYTFCPGC